MGACWCWNGKSKRNPIVFGKYDFEAPKPWLQLLTDPASLNITDEEMQQIVQPHLNAWKKQKNEAANKE
jgi:hypothetical protein